MLSQVRVKERLPYLCRRVVPLLIYVHENASLTDRPDQIWSVILALVQHGWLDRRYRLKFHQTPYVG